MASSSPPLLRGRGSRIGHQPLVSVPLPPTWPQATALCRARRRTRAAPLLGAHRHSIDCRSPGTCVCAAVDCRSPFPDTGGAPARRGDVQTAQGAADEGEAEPRGREAHCRPDLSQIPPRQRPPARPRSPARPSPPPLASTRATQHPVYPAKPRSTQPRATTPSWSAGGSRGRRGAPCGAHFLESPAGSGLLSGVRSSARSIRATSKWSHASAAASGVTSHRVFLVMSALPWSMRKRTISSWPSRQAR
mmetsp:Transcript_28842/g.80577  ORF Transcript_28842/g.80577 Transcript_28842/m.80577 type:complete len:248 (+) Transcript_28842:76-819(+)